MTWEDERSGARVRRRRRRGQDPSFSMSNEENILRVTLSNNNLSRNV